MFPADAECETSIALKHQHLRGTRQAHRQDAWKDMYVWVDGSHYRGREKAPSPSPEVLARELLKDEALGLRHRFGQHLGYMQGEDLPLEEILEFQGFQRALFDTITRIFSEHAKEYLAHENDSKEASPSRAFHAQLLQDSWVVSIFGGRRGGYFVDLAAHEAIALSNTLALERDYGWRGLCIEANHKHLRGLAFRNSTVVSAVVSNETGRLVMFDDNRDTAFAGVVLPETNIRDVREDEGLAHEEAAGRYREVSTVSIAKILEDMQAPDTIDYLSLDIEGSEHLVLESFPLAHNRPRGSRGGSSEEEETVSGQRAVWDQAATRQAGLSVMVISIELPNLCSRLILRRHGFHFLTGLQPRLAHADKDFASLPAQDEIWVHETFADFQRVMIEMGSPEPLSQRNEGVHLREGCNKFARELAHESLSVLLA